MARWRRSIGSSVCEQFTRSGSRVNARWRRRHGRSTAAGPASVDVTVGPDRAAPRSCAPPCCRGSTRRARRRRPCCTTSSTPTSTASWRRQWPPRGRSAASSSAMSATSSGSGSSNGASPGCCAFASGPCSAGITAAPPGRDHRCSQPPSYRTEAAPPPLGLTRQKTLQAKRAERVAHGGDRPRRVQTATHVLVERAAGRGAEQLHCASKPYRRESRR